MGRVGGYKNQFIHCFKLICIHPKGGAKANQETKTHPETTTKGCSSEPAGSSQFPTGTTAVTEV